MKKLCSILILMALTGCASYQRNPKVSVFIERVSSEDLASVRVGAPDVRHLKNSYGQSVCVKWKLPENYLGQPLKGVLSIRFNTASQDKIPFNIKKLKGSYCYELLDQEFLKKRGVFAYKVEIFSHDHLVTSNQSRLWTELIIFD